MPAADPYARRLLAVVLLSVVSFSSSMTIVTTALGRIAQDLGSSASTLSWGVSGLFLAMGIGTPVLGKLGDVKGHRPVFLVGAAVIVTGTVACGLAWSAASFVAARVVVGAGMAAAMPNGMALVLASVEPAARPRILGWFQMVMVGVPTLALIAGGPMVDAFGWRSVFALLAPVAATGLVCSLVVVRPGSRQTGVRIDWLGAGLLGLGVLAALLGLEAFSRGLGPAVGAGLLALAAVSIVGFVRVERRIAVPLIALDYFRIPEFTGSICANGMAQFAYIGGFVVAPLLLQERFGLSVGASALLLLARPASMSLCSPIGGRLGQRFGERPMVLVGAAGLAAGCAVLVAAALTEQTWLVPIALVLSGGAVGLAQPSYGTAVARSVDPGDLGVANGMSSTLVNLGMLSGIQAMFAVLGDGDSAGRYAAAFAVAGAVAVASVPFGLMMGRTRRVRPALTGAA
ncbi:MAG: MFS transporter [Acidimicrobiales bacterium]